MNEEIMNEIQPVRPKDQFPFSCRQCGACCRNIEGCVMVESLDAYRLVFDKPYDFYVEANAKGKTTGRVGPELVVGLTKRNAFRGGAVRLTGCTWCTDCLDFTPHR